MRDADQAALALSASDTAEPDPAPAEAGTPAYSAARLDDADFAVVLLTALTNMAARSKRRQADLAAALRGADIVAEPRRLRAALRLLQAQGAIENLVPLSDGGLLLTVTHAANDPFGDIAKWLTGEEGGDAPA